ncbi:hypothetical protein BO71DRAFT_2102 [Aspergillus ellipticus CBS 707.79]|uniref:Uncharacterized protein n=1 Tax=Aspergillus ellipticus CBS 707.79 TaxID=1448320 RepID=A0A319EH96_9EURO|nr:hypothetical protein BO71DRAFT_2102 [Aspergillus ellipticus CBS 707.79]
MSNSSSIITANSYLIPPQNRYQYTDIKQVTRWINEKFAQFEKAHGDQYLLIRDVSSIQLAALDYRSKIVRDLPSLRATYFEASSDLIVKLAGVPHERLSRLIYSMIENKSQALGIDQMLSASGAGRRKMESSISKEPDESWVPIGRAGNDYPSLVVEIGVSETENRLKTDAKIWLETSHGLTRIVILVLVEEDEKKIHIQRWQLAPTQPNIITRSISARMPDPVHRAQCMQKLTLHYIAQGNIQVTGAPLIIPVALIFDALPPLPSTVNVNTEFSYNEQQLAKMATSFFGFFGP